MGNTPPHPLDRAGLAARSETDDPAVSELRARLERLQEEFLAQEPAFRGADYPWPRDPLHTWSRVWEYPYACHHVARWRAGLPPEARPVLVDVGCGVTFLPFALARLGCHVIGADTDAICDRDLRRAMDAVPAGPGRVESRLIQQGRLPLGDREADAVICISVLEHIPDFTATIAEMHRVLKPGGLLVVTMDMSWRGGHAIGAEPYRRLRAALDQRFELVWPETTVHPADLLRSDEGPYPLPGIAGAARSIFLLKERVLKPLLGRQPKPRAPLLSVWGGVLRARAGQGR